MDVGNEGLLTTTLDGEVMEDKVPLPVRWLKGFAETQMLSSLMKPTHSLGCGSSPHVHPGVAAPIRHEKRHVGNPCGAFTEAGYPSHRRVGVRGWAGAAAGA